MSNWEENKAKWIAALESGDYEQGREYLKEPVDYQEDFSEPNRYVYCCLGVLKEVIPVSDPSINEATEDGSYLTEFYLNDVDFPNDLETAIRLAKIADADDRFNAGGVDHDNLDQMYKETQTVLASLNDTGFSFTEIAKFIKENM
jgi:hypothetical protein